MPSVRSVAPRFFFHVRSGAGSIDDLVGEYHFGAAAAHLRALALARDLRARWGEQPSCVVIVDDDGQELGIVPIIVSPGLVPVTPAE